MILVTFADQLSFVDHYKNIGKEYLILDIDNSQKKQNEFKVGDITNLFSDLHDEIYKVFCNAVTKKALLDWG